MNPIIDKAMDSEPTGTFSEKNTQRRNWLVNRLMPNTKNSNRPFAHIRNQEQQNNERPFKHLLEENKT